MLEALVYITVMAISPGPNTILSMVNASRQGLKKGIWLNLGMLAGITIVTILSFIFSSFFYRYIPQAELIMKAVCFIYLIFLALKMLFMKVSSETSASEGFVQGMILQLINVKVILLALTAVSTYIIPMTDSTARQFLLSIIIPLDCFISGLVWAIGGSLLKSFFSRHTRLMSVLFFLALVWCALRLFI